MEPKRTGMALIGFVLLAAFIWALFAYGIPGASQSQSAVPEQSVAGAGMTLRHFISDGMHTYIGAVTTPTPCHQVAAGASVSYGKPPKGTITISTSLPEGTVCAQVLTSQEFSVAFSSDETPEVAVIVDGKEQQASIVEGQ